MLHSMYYTSSAALAALTALTAMNAEGSTVQTLAGDAEPELVAIMSAVADAGAAAAEPDAYFTVHNTVWDVPDPRLSLPFSSIMQGPDLAAAAGHAQAPGDQLVEFAEGIPVKANSVYTVRALHNTAVDKVVALMHSFGPVFPITAGHGHRWLRLTSPANAGNAAWASGPTIAPGGTVALPPDRDYLITGGLARPTTSGAVLEAVRLSGPQFMECRPGIPVVRSRMTAPWHTFGLWSEGMPFSGKDTITLEGWASAAGVGWEAYVLVSETARSGEKVPAKGGKLPTVTALGGGGGGGGGLQPVQGGLGGLLRAFG